MQPQPFPLTHSALCPTPAPPSFEARQELFCLDVLDNVVAAGGQGDVLFWDRRTRKPLAAFDDMHMDDVTQVGGPGDAYKPGGGRQRTGGAAAAGRRLGVASCRVVLPDTTRPSPQPPPPCALDPRSASTRPPRAS
jgi:hypothetical protein